MPDYEVTISEVGSKVVAAEAAPQTISMPVGFDPTKIIPVIQDLVPLWNDAVFRKFLTDFAALFGLTLPFSPGPTPTPNPNPNPAPNPTP